MKFQCEACERLVPLEVFRVEAGVLVVKCDRCGAESRARMASSVAVGASSLSGEGASGTPGSPPREPPVAAVPGSPPAAAVLGSPPVAAMPGPPPAAAVPGSSPVAAMPGPLPAPPRASSPSLRVVRGREASVPLSGEALFEPPPGHCPKCVAPRREDAEACAQCGLVYVNFNADEHRPSDVLADAWQALAAQWDDWDAHDRLMTLAMGRGELAMLGRLYRLRLARAPDDVMAQRGRDELVRRATLVVPATSEVASGSSVSQKRVKAIGVTVLLLVMLVMAVLMFQNLRALMAGP
ncbi:hypothetical protein JY651_46695 [Pyxidicoccus parkwayensis]|uniref:Zinc finger/thioredoxin putative domain-containing protein n=1 Tax=Pyxidicoccus parkwayensis TaxID=2813578 RepID=A0ABX7NVY5_9BACT|nr:hypothetical protein [Pyxidicoccus parkwaysis]QSQ22524.1 hypothetical protein JY651_46695 [Pyxidicoccus parkwaysis]